MGRPVTLFTGQWADLSLDDVSRKAKDFGYDGFTRGVHVSYNIGENNLTLFQTIYLTSTLGEAVTRPLLDTFMA